MTDKQAYLNYMLFFFHQDKHKEFSIPYSEEFPALNYPMLELVTTEIMDAIKKNDYPNVNDEDVPAVIDIEISNYPSIEDLESQKLEAIRNVCRKCLKLYQSYDEAKAHIIEVHNRDIYVGGELLPKESPDETLSYLKLAFDHFKPESQSEPIIQPELETTVQ